ncbi:MAG TPA: nitronate monooxygenase, partial [Deinococcales bacterium]|nr:nitronate monooxygenase [Deinococcales bacterium]
MAERSRALSRLLGCEFPLVQAPMAGGTSTPALAAAVSEAGGLGSLACGYLAPEALEREVAEARALTGRPFAVNLFVQHESPPAPDAAALRAALEALAPFHAELGLEPPALPEAPPPSFDRQLDAVLRARPAVFSFTFGLPTPPHMAAL